MTSEILGARIHRVTMTEALRRIENFIDRSQLDQEVSHQVITLNAEILYRATQDAHLMDIINQAALVTPDGAGILWAGKKLRRPLPERVTGIDLLQALAPVAAEKGWRLYLYGGAPGIAPKAAAQLEQLQPGIKIVGTSHGFIPPEEAGALTEAIRRAKPHLLLVALGAPRQEFWLAEHLPALAVPVAIGVGGSFDVLAGEAKRAPRWVQKAHLEWLYRLLKEPWRYKRMLALPAFMAAVRREAHRAEK